MAFLHLVYKHANPFIFMIDDDKIDQVYDNISTLFDKYLVGSVSGVPVPAKAFWFSVGEKDRVFLVFEDLLFIGTTRALPDPSAVSPSPIMRQ